MSRVSFRALLCIYALVPAAWLLVLLDSHLMQDWLLNNLPAYPEQSRLFLVFFVWPHIFASLISMLDGEYLHAYRSKLIYALPVALALPWLLQFLAGPGIALLVFSFATVLHVVGQQLGIALLTLRAKTPWYQAWRVSCVFVAAYVYLSAYHSLFDLPNEWSLRLDVWLNRVGVIALGIALLASIFVMANARSRLGAGLVFANTLLVVSIWLWVGQGWAFLAVLIPRCMHDITAFMFYSVHDRNRRATKARAMALPAFLLTPILGLIVGNAFVELSIFPWVSQALLSVAYLHYGLESFIWQRGSPHRRSIQFAA